MQRADGGFGMVDVQRCVLRKALRLKGGAIASAARPRCSRRQLAAAIACVAAATAEQPGRASAFPPPVGDVDLLLPLLQCREIVAASSTTVAAARTTSEVDWNGLQRALNRPPITQPAKGREAAVVGSGFRATSEAYFKSLRYTAELDDADRAFCYVSKAVKIDAQCLQRLYTSDRTYRRGATDAATPHPGRDVGPPN